MRIKKYLFTALIIFSSIVIGNTQSEIDLEKLREKIKSEQPSEKVYDLLNKQFPECSLNLLDEKNLVTADLKGKRTIINFWFTNCQPCLDEIPLLNEIKSELNSEEYNFIAITYQNSNEINEFLKSTEFNYKHVVDEKDLIDKLGIRFYPKTLILNEELKIIRIDKRLPFDSSDKEIESWKQDIIDELKY